MCCKLTFLLSHNDSFWEKGLKQGFVDLASQAEKVHEDTKSRRRTLRNSVN